MKYFKILITVLTILMLNQISLAQTGSAVHFIGTDGNWFEPTNWDSGIVPDDSTNIILSNGQHVIIDPALSPTGSIMVNDITLEDATLSTFENTVFEYNNLIINGASLFDAQSSDIRGDELLLNSDSTIASGGGWSGMTLNPTTNDNRSIKIVANTSKLHLFLGGIEAGTPSNVGLGHYARLTADDIELDGALEIGTIYGFQPQVGDIFEIIKARQNLIGAFNNFRDGDVVASFDGIDLVLSYENNTDGSISVLLTSVQWPFRMSYVGTDGDWFNPNNWIDENTGAPANRTPKANDDIIIAGETDIMINPPNNQPIVIRNMTIDDDRTLNLANGTEFVFQQLNIINGLFETHSSIIRGRNLMMANTPNDKSTSKRPGGWGCSHCGVYLGNPSLTEIDVQNYGGILAVGLGGTIQSQDGKVGSGSYASFTGDNINISGELVVQLFYGFEPSIGDTFQIITANNLSGQFTGLNEGDFVAHFDDIGLTISYQGGDGNDVVLTAIEFDDLIFSNGFEL